MKVIIVRVAGTAVEAAGVPYLDDPPPVPSRRDDDTWFVGWPADADIPTGNTHYVVWNNGLPELVAYTPQQAAAKRSRPPFPAQWDDTTMSWADLRTDDDLRAEVRARALTDIEGLERPTLRLMREAILGRPAALAALQAIDNDIAALRDRANNPTAPPRTRSA